MCGSGRFSMHKLEACDKAIFGPDDLIAPIPTRPTPFITLIPGQARSRDCYTCTYGSGRFSVHKLEAFDKAIFGPDDPIPMPFYSFHHSDTRACEVMCGSGRLIHHALIGSVRQGYFFALMIHFF